MNQRGKASAVVLLSGGIDSTTLLAQVISDDPGYVHALSFMYGQKHSVEVEQAAQIACSYSLPHHEVITVPSVFGGAGSALIEGEMPHLTYEEISEAEGPSPTYVPFRNGTLLSLATAYALVVEAETIYYAPHAEDAHNWAYPDCTPEFNGAMASAVYIGSYGKVRLATPFQWMKKHEIIALGARLGVPFDLTHSCYEGERPACGLCPTCVARLAAFRQAGVIDPIPYATLPA